MQAPVGPRRSDWQPGHIPKLSYRNAVPPEDLVSYAPDTQAHQKTEHRRPSTSPAVHEERQGLPARPAPPQLAPPWVPPVSPPPQKKRNSLFGGLFVKEPTLVALDQVAAQLIAQHGSTTPQAVPHVSSRKMPDHVPRVNAKWDGVPEAVKIRERQEKERNRAAKRFSPGPESTRSRSRDPPVHTSRPPRDALQRQFSDAPSTAGSWDSRSSQSRGAHHHHHPTRPESAYSDSSFEPPHPTSLSPASFRSQSLRSPSGTSLPEITAFFPNDIPTHPSIPKPCQSTKSFPTHSTAASSRTRVDPDPRLVHHSLPINAIPERVSSSTTTTREGSPATASTHPEGEITSQAVSGEAMSFRTSHSESPDLPLPMKKKAIIPAPAFLAGEARPLKLPEDDEGAPLRCDTPSSQDIPAFKAPLLPSAARLQQDVTKRPDSSRDRLGLRASMVIRTEAAPWENPNDWRDPNLHARSTSPRLQSPTSPKTKFAKPFGLFGKDRI